mgnify:CR=1 FL=1
MLIKNTTHSILYFLKCMRMDIIFIVVYAVIMGTVDHNTFLKNIAIPLPVTTITGTVVALLLAFRTAQSYDRWWEARKVWGEIVNDSRTITRQFKQFLPSSDASAELAKFAERQIIWCYALSETLRAQPFSAKVQLNLKNNDIESNNVPAGLLDRHSVQLAVVSQKFALNDNKQVQIDTTLARLNDAMGKCERIKNTVFPKSYSLLIHFLIYCLASILPFGLDDTFPLLEILLTMIIPLMLIAVEQTAIIMQNPFENQPTDIPMTRLSDIIEVNINEIVSGKKIVAVSGSESYYIN